MRLVQSLRSTTQVPKSMRTLNASNFTSILGGKVSSSLACDKPEAGYGSLSVQVPGLIHTKLQYPYLQVSVCQRNNFWFDSIQSFKYHNF